MSSRVTGISTPTAITELVVTAEGSGAGTATAARQTREAWRLANEAGLIDGLRKLGHAVEADGADGFRAATRAQLKEGADPIAEWSVVNTTVKEAVAKFLYDETHRRPMVLPIAVEI